MNSRLHNVYFLSAMLLLTACGRESIVGPRHTTMISRSWPASDIRHLRVFEVSGSVRVEAATTDKISLEATVRGRRRPRAGEDNQGLFRTDIDGETLRIGRTRDRKRGFRFVFGHDRTTVDYVLKVPPTVSLDLGTVNGRVVTRGIEGQTEASSVNGTIDVEVTGGEELTATTVNGRVRAKFTHAFNGAKFKSVNGGVEAALPGNASFTVDLAQVNGDFEAAFPLSIHSQPGSRRVSGEVNGGQHRLKIVTVNGDVELTKVGEKL